MKKTFPKTERLKSKKQIQLLFSKGKSVSAFPLHLVYLKTSFPNSVLIKIGVTVSKKNFKKAVERNYIKRLLREAYRTQKQSLYNNNTTQFAFLFIYVGNELPNFEQIEKKMKEVLQKFKQKNL